MNNRPFWRALLLTVIFYVSCSGGKQVLAGVDFPQSPRIAFTEEIEEIIKEIIEGAFISYWTLEELIEYYREEMAHRHWILKELKIEEKEAELIFVSGDAKVEIEIEVEEGIPKVKVKSSRWR